MDSFYSTLNKLPRTVAIVSLIPYAPTGGLNIYMQMI